MTTRIRTDDGAIGKSLATKRKKIDDSERAVCELKIQMTVQRQDLAALAGIPIEVVQALYTDEGIPVTQMSVLLPKRELQVSGTITRGGDGFEAKLSIKKAIASDIHFVPEPNVAVFVCKLSWLAAGDEVEDIKEMLGCFCAVDLKFKTPAEQQQLALVNGHGKAKGNGAEKHQATIAAGLATVRGDLATLGIELPDEHPLWSTITPMELSRVMEFVDKRKQGKNPNMPAILKPLVRKDQPKPEA